VLFFVPLIEVLLYVHNISPTSGPSEDSMSAASEPMRWGVSRQAKGREFNPTRVDISTLLTLRGVLSRVPGVSWGGKKKTTMLSIKQFASD
jgi:hypothetical protein